MAEPSKEYITIVECPDYKNYDEVVVYVLGKYYLIHLPVMDNLQERIRIKRLAEVKIRYRLKCKISPRKKMGRPKLTHIPTYDHT